MNRNFHKPGTGGARACGCLLLLALAASGCMRVVPMDATMPPLISGLRNVETVAVGDFEAEDGTPAEAADRAAELLAEELAACPWYELAEPAAAHVVVSGRVRCRIVNGTARRAGERLPTRTAEVQVVFAGTAGKTITLFTVTETPAVADKQRLDADFPEAAEIRDALLRSCVEQLIDDLSPRPARVLLPRPVFHGSSRTRRGIDLLSTNPARAVDELTKALERDSDDAAARNALGFCSEVAGNLELAFSSYLDAAATDPRDEYRENMQRAYALLERQRRIEGREPEPGSEPQ